MSKKLDLRMEITDPYIADGVRHLMDVKYDNVRGAMGVLVRQALTQFIKHELPNGVPMSEEELNGASANVQD
tara:strand:+ start:177 stop:392 length:216 start_codon:yes stop_codon:yes gene_type:complete